MKNQRMQPACRGTATGRERRIERGMQGLLPPRLTSLQAEIDRAHAAIARCCTPLEKYQVRTSLGLGQPQKVHVPLHRLPSHAEATI